MRFSYECIINCWCIIDLFTRVVCTYINAAAGWRGNIDEMLAVCNTVAFIIIRLSTIFRLSQMAEESAGFRNMIYYTG